MVGTGGREAPDPEKGDRLMADYATAVIDPLLSPVARNRPDFLRSPPELVVLSRRRRRDIPRIRRHWLAPDALADAGAKTAHTRAF